MTTPQCWCVPCCSLGQNSPMVATREKFRIQHHRVIPKQGEFSVRGTATPPLEETIDASGLGRNSFRSPTLTKRHGYPTWRRGSTPRRQAGASSGWNKSFPAAAFTHLRAPTAVKVADPVDPTAPSSVVVDGSNVAFAYREDVSHPEWSPQGILLALKVRMVACIGPCVVSLRRGTFCCSSGSFEC